MQASETTASQDQRRPRRLASATAWTESAATVAIVPAFIVSQWLAIRWDLPTRFVFNAAVLAAAGLVLVGRFEKLARRKTELAAGVVVSTAIILSVLVNGVTMRTAISGSVPYLMFVWVGVAASVAGPSPRDIVTGVRVAVASTAVMGIAAVAQLALGRTGFVVTAQDLRYPRWWERVRATGLVANPGRLGQVGVAAMALSPLAATRPWLWATGAGIAIGASGSRTAIAAGLMLGVAWILLDRRGVAGRAVAIGAIAIVVTTAVVQVASQAARDDFWGRSALVIDELIADDDIVAEVRVANLRAGVDAWSDHMVLGAGPGRFGSTTAWRERSSLHERYGLPDVRSEEFVAQLRAAGIEDDVDVGVAQLDNGWLQVATEIGALGVAGILALITGLAWRAWKHHSVAGLALLGALSLFSITAPGLVDVSLAAVFLWWAGLDLGDTLSADGSST